MPSCEKGTILQKTFSCILIKVLFYSLIFKTIFMVISGFHITVIHLCGVWCGFSKHMYSGIKTKKRTYLPSPLFIVTAFMHIQNLLVIWKYILNCYECSLLYYAIYSCLYLLAMFFPSFLNFCNPILCCFHSCWSLGSGKEWGHTLFVKWGQIVVIFQSFLFQLA